MRDMLNKMFLSTNDTLFSQNILQRGKEVALQVVWHPSIAQNLFDFMASA